MGDAFMTSYWSRETNNYFTKMHHLKSFVINDYNECPCLVNLIKVKKRIAVCATSTAPLQELTCHMGSDSVTCHPAEVTSPPLPQPIKAGTRFIDPRGMQGWVDLVGLVTYQGGIRARRRSPILVLTGLNVQQLRTMNDATTALNRQPYHTFVHRGKN